MTAKRVVRSAFGTLSEARLLQPLVRRLALGRVNVVYYHFVGKTTSYYAEFYKGCTLERFQRDIATLRTLFEVVPLAKMIEFKSHNLMDAHWSLGDPFDIVFCRNVMIYFDGPTQRRVLERIHRVMKPGSLLYVGHSENFSEARDLFHLRGKTIYQRV